MNILVVYGTTEGQTRKIARFIENILKSEIWGSSTPTQISGVFKIRIENIRKTCFNFFCLGILGAMT